MINIFLWTLAVIFPVYSEAGILAIISPTRSWQIVAPGAARFDPSGLVFHDERWLVVSDKRKYPHIYELKPDGDTLRAEIYIKLKKHKKIGKTDFEGIAVCGDVILICEEKSTSIISVDAAGKYEQHKIDLAPIYKKHGMPAAFGKHNAGLEGIACGAGKVYTSNERQFRMIYEHDPESYEVVNMFDVPAGWNLPARVGEKSLYADFADLAFDGGYLYALQRNDHTIHKIDPQTRRSLSRVRFDINEKELYDYGAPFGMSEGLFLKDDEIYILLDNNGFALRGQPKNKNALLFVFARPEGF